MHIVIVGPGALGTLLTARLMLAPPGEGMTGNDVLITLLDHRPSRAQLLARDGLILDDAAGSHHCRPSVTADPRVCAAADLVLLCVKAPALAATLGQIRPFLAARQLVIGLQNGIAHLELLAALPCIAGVGITTEGATLLGTGHVRHGGAGLTLLGLLQQPTSSAGLLLARTAAVFNRAGLASRVTDSPLRHLWAKLFINVGINALTAILRCPNGELLASTMARETMTLAIREAEAVARAAGIAIDEDPVAAAFRVCAATRDNISSMHQDILRQRPTEIEAINGAVVAAGQRFGIATPVNSEMVRQVRELEAAYAGKRSRK